MGRRGGAAGLAGRAGTPAPQRRPREPALGAEPLPGSPFPRESCFPEGIKGAAAGGGRAGRFHGRQGGFARAECEESCSCHRDLA